MKFFQNWNSSKAVMLWAFIILSVCIWLWLLPSRNTFWPGGEMFIPFLAIGINYIPELLIAGKDLLRELDDIICVWLNDNFGGE